MPAHASGHLCPMPFQKDFYADLLGRRAQWEAASSRVLRDDGGLACRVAAGQALRLRLLEGAQIVHCFPFNADDPDERYYAQHTILIEGLWLTRFSRMFGTMARYRPLMTVLEDTVAAPRGPGLSSPGWHHPAFGGWGTPADWRFSGGRGGVRSAWEQLVGLLRAGGHDPALVKDEACFFQKVAIDPDGRAVRHLGSDAMAGDCVTLFAEIDLVVLLALSPYRDGSRPAAAIGDGGPRAVEVTVFEALATPLAWPYPGEPYPDIGGYLDERGRRSVAVADGLGPQEEGR